MIPIYICEDRKEQLDAIVRIIENFIFINSFDMEIKGCFQEPDMLIACIKRNEPVTGLYFLDIDLKSDMDGVKLAEIIREYDARAFIVFITTHEEMAMYTLKKRVEPLDFIIKGTSDFASQIEKCLKNTLKNFLLPVILSQIQLQFVLQIILFF